LHIRNEHDVFYAAFLLDMSCVRKFFSGTIELPDASVLLDLLPQTPGKS